MNWSEFVICIIQRLGETLYTIHAEQQILGRSQYPLSFMRRINFGLWPQIDLASLLVSVKIHRFQK